VRGGLDVTLDGSENSFVTRKGYAIHDRAKPIEKHFYYIYLPGSGKTKLVKQLVDALREYDPARFYTEGIRSHGTRTGFKLTSPEQTYILAHVDIKGPHRIGKYVIDLP